jgi:hypothetical protein
VASASELVGKLTGVALVLVAVGVLQASSAIAIRRGTPRALTGTVILNALLIVAWALSRAGGLHGGGGGQPIGLLDTLCVTASLTIGVLAGALALAPARLAHWRAVTAAPHVAILLAVASLSALAAGHTHSGASKPGVTPHLYCRLL